jgi:hypothetical protein
LLVSIDVDEAPEANATQRMQDENVLMIALHAFLADQRVARELQDALQGWARDRTIERVLIMALSAKHPDGPPGRA